MHAAIRLMQKGHEPYCPHLTFYLNEYAETIGVEFSHSDWLRVDKPWLCVCGAILYLGPSPGADEELGLALSRELTVYRSVDEVPDA